MVQIIDYTFFQLLCKSNVNFDTVMTQFYLAFLKS